MVTAQTQYNLANARSYFAEHLSVGDYYQEGQRVSGEWFGRAAERLGLKGRIHTDPFLRLCENQEPSTGKRLTQRLNPSQAKARRVFYDFTFSPPKSVSVAALVAGDDRIVEAHERSVRVALREFEAFAATRVRMGKANTDRPTGNLAIGLFTHDTSRALDPHLHTHAIVFNATWDPVERRWKALQNHELLQARKFAENTYYHELARALVGFGYSLRDRLQGDFQIEGISPDLCQRFSKRHGQIDEALARLLSDKPELRRGNLNLLRSRIASAERARKQKDLGRDELRSLWDAQVTAAERESFRHLTTRPRTERPSLREAIEWAEEHLFERHSVVPEHRLWEQALARARGGDFTLEELKTFTARRPYLRDEANPRALTLPEVLEREKAILRHAQEGLGRHAPLVPVPGVPDSRLDADQRAAWIALSASTDFVTLFRGGAGTGKSFVLRQLVDQLTGPVIVLAPQRQQVVEMEKAGFPSPTTVSRFLMARHCPRGAVLLVDEAGQIGGRQMLELLRLASGARARVILSGDTRQHGPVEASDALIAIERKAGIKPVELHRIRRQDPRLGRDPAESKRIGEYLGAVEWAAQGDLAKSFEGLERMGAIVECPPFEQPETLAAEYLRLAEAGATTVVVSQTWSEVARVNERIRIGLKEKGLLGAQDHAVDILEPLDLTQAQKRDARFFPPEAVVVFNRKTREVAPGSTGKLAAILKDGILVETGGRLVRLKHAQLDQVSVALARQIAVSEGERLHLKANRRLVSGARVTNGELVTVKAVTARGVELVDGRVLDPAYREFLPGYAITSYGSQGKTVDHVLLSDSTVKAATNAEQWYVSISRGRKGIRIFTPDKEALRENILRSGRRPLAVEMKIRHSVAPPRLRALRSRLMRFGRQTVERLGLVRFSRRHERTARVLGV